MESNIDTAKSSMTSNEKPTGLKLFFKKLVEQRMLVFMSVPFLIWLFLFKYLPLWGWTTAFQRYRPNKSFSDQEWVGFDQFKLLFHDERFIRVLRNTLAQSGINLVLGFVTAITLALLLNELRVILFKRIVQTVTYMPHFLSWVVAAGIIQATLAPDGIINVLMIKMGMIEKGQELLFLGIPKDFWTILGLGTVWKDLGWNTIVYLAAMATIDPAQYEAAEMDGAGRFRRMWNVTLPGIKSVIVVLLILNIGNLMESGFEAQYLLKNGMNIDYSENIDIFVLTYGINQSNFSLAVAAGMFKSVVSIVLLLIANSIAKRAGESRLF